MAIRKAILLERKLGTTEPVKKDSNFPKVGISD